MLRNICECCDSDRVTKIGIHDNFEHYQCLSCGYEFFMREDFDIENHLYELDSDYIDDLSVSKNYNDLMQWNHMKALSYLKTRFPTRHLKALDVGCFNGFFVKKMLRMGFDAYGIDFNNKAVEYGEREYGLRHRISTKSIDDLLIEHHKFDIVTLFEIIEHIQNPKKFLHKVSKILKAGGLVIISVPNKRMCWRPSLDYPPHHLSRFDRGALERCLFTIGIRTKLIMEQMSVYDLVRNYIGSLFRKSDKRSLRGGAFKNKVLVNVVRIILNKSRKLSYIFLMPLDHICFLLGLRYISLLVIAEKSR